MEEVVRSVRHERERQSYKGVCPNDGNVTYAKRSNGKWYPVQYDGLKFGGHDYEPWKLICLECGKHIE